MSTGEEQQKRTVEVETAKADFQAGLDVDEDFASLLISEGFITLDDLAYCAVEDIAAIEGLDPDLATEIQKRARNALLDKAMQAGESKEGETAPSLLDLKGMTREVAGQLAAREMATVAALADAAVDEIEDIEGLSRNQAEALILAAREASGWFE
jgi:N utilization substance protein A